MDPHKRGVGKRNCFTGPTVKTLGEKLHGRLKKETTAKIPPGYLPEHSNKR